MLIFDVNAFDPVNEMRLEAASFETPCFASVVDIFPRWDDRSNVES
jgi:hypothetical protein